MAIQPGSAQAIVAATLGAYHGTPVADLPPPPAPVEVEVKKPEESPRSLSGRHTLHIKITPPLTAPASAPVLRRASTESDAGKDRRLSTHLERPLQKSPRIEPAAAEPVLPPIPALPSSPSESPRLTAMDLSPPSLATPRVVDFDAVSMQILEFGIAIGKKWQEAESEGFLIDHLAAQVDAGRIRLEEYEDKAGMIRSLRSYLDMQFKQLNELEKTYGLMHTESVREIYYTLIKGLDFKRGQLDGMIQNFGLILSAHVNLKEYDHQVEGLAKKVNEFVEKRVGVLAEVKRDLEDLKACTTLIHPMHFMDRNDELFCRRHWDKKVDILSRIEVQLHRLNVIAIGEQLKASTRLDTEFGAKWGGAADGMSQKLLEARLKRLERKPKEEAPKPSMTPALALEAPLIKVKKIEMADEVRKSQEEDEHRSKAQEAKALYEKEEAARRAKELDEAERRAKSEAQAKERMELQKKQRDQQEAERKAQAAKEKMEAQRAREAAAAAAAEAEMARRAKELEAERAQRAREAEERKKHFATVSVSFDAGPGNVLGIRGDPDWQRSVPFTHTAAGWKGEIPLGKSFKFVSIPSQGEVKWEKGDNRNIKEHDKAQSEISARRIEF